MSEPPAPVTPPTEVTLTFGFHLSDNTLIPDSRITTTIPTPPPGEAWNIRLPMDHPVPLEAVYARVDIDGQDPVIIPIATDPAERAIYGLMGRTA